MNDIFLLNQARQLAEEATDNTMDKAIHMLIKEFLAMNVETPIAIPEMKVEYFTGNDAKYTGISHVCMDIDNKVAVATSKHTLLINPDEFTEVEGHDSGLVVVDINNRTKVVDGLFPQYKHIVPTEKETTKVTLFSMQDIIFRSKHAIVEARMNNIQLPVVKIGDNIKNKCNIFVAVSKVPFLMLAGTDGWRAMQDKKDFLQRPLVKRFEDGKVMLIMPSQPGK